MKKGRMKRMAGVVLAAALLFSDVFSFQSEAFPAGSVLEDDETDESDVGAIETADGISSGEKDASEEDRTAGTGRTEEEGEDGISAETKEDSETEGGEEPLEETETETETDDLEEETKNQEGRDGEGGLSVSGNGVWEDTSEIPMNENGETEEETESAIGEITGATIPVKGIVIPLIQADLDYEASGEYKPESRYILEDAKQGKTVTPATAEKDWAFALCSALESNLRVKYGEDVSIDREAFVNYLYAKTEDKAAVIDGEYGDISKDLVNDPGQGTGNTLTAMWAVASGYAVKNLNASGRKYRLDDIYLYNGAEKKKIKYAVETRGEVVASIYRAEGCFYENGGQTGDEYGLSYHCPVSTDHTGNMEHTVTIVGWDDSYNRSQFLNSEDLDGNGAWLVKDAYGYKGQHYYWVSYYESVFWNGKANDVFCYSFDVSKDGSGAHTYQYDGSSGSLRYGNCTKAVNIFPKAGKDEVLNAVSFGTLTKYAQYKIQVYLEARPAEDGSGELVLEKPLFKEPILTKEGECSQWGYYTIDFNQVGEEKYACEPRLCKPNGGESWFAVEVEIVGGNSAFWVDKATDEGIEPVCRPDADAVRQSYVYKDGMWVDLGSEAGGANVRIKAHTKDRFSLKASSGNVWLGDSLKLEATIGGEPVGMQEGLRWSSDNERIAVVSEDGAVDLKAAGYVNFTVTSETYGSDTVGIMVKDVSVTEQLLLCSNSINMEKRKGQIECIFTPSGYVPHHIEYSVAKEHEQYLRIDENGEVTARDEAAARKIPVLLKIFDDEDNYIMKEVTVSCYQVPVEFKIVNENQELQDNFEMRVTGERQLGIRVVEPESADVSDIRWKSSNAAVVSVSSKGKLYALKEGTAVITAFSRDDPERKTQVTVTVRAGVTGVSFSQSYISLMPNESKELAVKVLPGNISNPEIKWSMKDLEGNDLGLRNRNVSFDPETGTLAAGNEDMEVTRLKLYAECDGVIGSCFIKVDIPVQRLQLSFSESGIVTYKTAETSATEQKSDSIRLYPHLKPAALSAKDTIIFYSSDNPDVARVTKDGEVIPLKSGSVYLTARTGNGCSAQVRLTIRSLYTATALSMDVSEGKIYVGGQGGAEPETTLAAVKTGDGTTAPAGDFYWESSDESVASVDEEGKITAVSKGWVTITATDRMDSSNRAELDLRVGIGIREIRAKRDMMEIALGKKVVLEYDVLPLDADAQGVTLRAEDEEIVSCSGNTVYALKVGITRVYMESEHGFMKEVLVEVKGREAKNIDVKLMRDGSEAEYITTKGTAGSLALIKAEAVDEYGNTAGISQIFDYYSEDPDIARVDENGYITGGNEGETHIRVLTTDGSERNTYVTVTVQKEESGIKSVALNHSKVELENGEMLELIASVLPENAPGMHEVTWQSMDEAVAAVDADGRVQALGYGRTTVVARSMDGRKSASCEIRVLPMDSQVKLLKIDSQVLESKSVNPESSYQVAVYASDGKDYRKYCEFGSSDETVCTVDERGLVVPAAQKNAGTCTITAKVKNDPSGRKVSFKVKLTDEKQAADIRIYAGLSTGKQEIGNQAPLYLPCETGKEMELEGFATDRSGGLMEDSVLKWSVSDKKVVSVKERKDGKAGLTVKGSGSCILTCSIKNQPQVKVSVPVYVYDRKPALAAKGLSVNLLKEESILLPVKACAGTEIEEFHPVYIKKGKQYWDGGFDIAKDSGSGRYVLNYNEEYLSKGNYVVYAKAVMRFDDSKEGRILKEIYHNQERYTEILEIPVKVTSQQPKIKIKQPTVNVFEKSAKTQLEIITGEEIDSVSLSDGKSTGISEKFNISKNAEGFWLNASADTKGTFHAVLQICLKGYVNPVPVKCTIKTVANKPRLTASPEKICVYKKDGGTADVAFRILDASRGEYISQAAGYVISGGVLEGDRVTVNVPGDYGKKTIELSVSNETLWNDTVLLKVPVTVEDESKITLEASKDKLTLNKRLDRDTALLQVYMKQQNVQISSIEDVYIYKEKNKLSRDIAWQPAENEENAIEFWAKESCEKGKYTAEITVKALLESPSGSTTAKTYTKSVSIVVEDVLPTVKVKLKGSIDLYDRPGTYMTGTVAVSHAASKVVDVTSEREDFEVAYHQDEERFTLALKPNNMVSKKKQTVILKIRLDNGTELKKAVSVNLKQSKIKWGKQEAAVFYKGRGSRDVLIPFETEAPANADVRIRVLSLPKGMMAETGHNQIRVLIEDDGIKPGKYKIKTAIRILDTDGITPMDYATVKKEIVVFVE